MIVAAALKSQPKQTAKPRSRQFLMRRFPGQALAIRRFLKTLQSWLRTHHIGATRCHDIELALAEVLNNIREHALISCPNTEITVQCRKTPVMLSVVVKDFGPPMPDETPPKGLPPPVLAQCPDLPEGGFGWMLVNELATKVRYNRQADCNQLHLHFDPEPADPPEFKLQRLKQSQ